MRPDVLVQFLLYICMGWCATFVVSETQTCEFQTTSDKAGECADNSALPKWSPVDDPKAELFPSRAVNRPYQACFESKPKTLAHMTLLEFYDAKSSIYQQSNQIFVGLNGQNTGAVIELDNLDCLGTLASYAYDILAPKQWERRGPKFLYSSGGLPIRNAQDIETRARRELYVLNSRQTWVWPAHQIHLQFVVENLTLVTVSDQPRVFMIEGLITKEDCEDIINEYDSKLVPSPEKHYSDQYKDHRTSETGWMKDHPMRYAIHRILRYPTLEYVENLQFLKYRPGKWYKHHHDYFHNYEINYIQALRRWMRMRIAAIAEIPDDWKETNEELVHFEPMLFETRKVINDNIQVPRGIAKLKTLKAASAPVLDFVLHLDENVPRVLSSKLFSEFKIKRDGAAMATLNEILEDDEQLAKVSHIMASMIGSELSMEEELHSVLAHGTKADEVSILETEPLLSSIQPNRHATVLPYLNDVEEGGETVLPHALHPEAFLGEEFQYPVYEGIPECSQGLLIKPKQGSASLFYHRLPSGKLDKLSLHAGCPPKKGIKYAINGFTWACPTNYGLSHFVD